MPLNASVVLSKGTGPHRVTLSPTTPEVIVDAGGIGASVAIVSGTALTVVVDNDFVPAGTWVTAANPTAVAGGRMAFKQASRDHVPLSVTWN